MPNPSDPGHNPFDPRAGHKVDPRDPWSAGRPVTDTAAPAPGPAQGVGGRPGRDTPDMGSPGLRLMTWLLIVVLFGMTIFLQQCSDGSPPAAGSPPASDQSPAGPDPTTDPAAADEPQASSTSEPAPDPDSDLNALMTRLFIKIAHVAEAAEPGSAAPLLEQIDGAAHTSADPFLDRIRAAIAAAEMAGVGEAQARLDQIQTDVEANADGTIEPEKAEAIALDVRLLRGVYAGHADALTDAERDHLIGRHGKIGEIALTHGKPESDPERARLVGGGGVLMLAFGGFALLLALVIPASLACAIIALVRMTSRRAATAFVPPTPGGSVYLETLAVFLLLFLLVQLCGAILGTVFPSIDERQLTMFALLAQWPVALTAFWPVLRGMPLGEHARRMGWTRGRGVFREIGAGIFGYLAGLPLVMIAMMITLVAVLMRSALQHQAGEAVEPPQNPVIDLALAGGALPLALAMLAVVWAPFTEESIFRGALYRHVRGRIGMFVASVLTALFFGFMHGYEVIALLPVMTLGFNFALMREWRGSLIGPMVAHALHNGTVMALLLIVLSQLR